MIIEWISIYPIAPTVRNKFAGSVSNVAPCVVAIGVKHAALVMGLGMDVLYVMKKFVKIQSMEYNVEHQCVVLVFVVNV